MAVVSLVRFKHCVVSPEDSPFLSPCPVCSKSVEGPALAHKVDLIWHVCHKKCLFNWFLTKEACPLCDLRVEPFPFFHYPLLPDIRISALDSPQNQMAVAAEVAAIFGFFLTRSAHQGELFEELCKIGVKTVGTSYDPIYVSEEKIAEFIKVFTNEIAGWLEQVGPEGSLHLQKVTYHSGTISLFEKAFEEAGIDTDKGFALIPRDSCALLEREGGRLFGRITF